MVNQSFHPRVRAALKQWAQVDAIRFQSKKMHQELGRAQAQLIWQTEESAQENSRLYIKNKTAKIAQLALQLTELTRKATLLSIQATPPSWGLCIGGGFSFESPNGTTYLALKTCRPITVLQEDTQGITFHLIGVNSEGTVMSIIAAPMSTQITPSSSNLLNFRCFS